MQSICLHDKNEIEKILRRDIFLHVYEIGDLDDLFWPHTRYYTLPRESDQPVLLLYTGLALPTILALVRAPVDPMKELIRSMIHLFPKKLYVHLSDGLLNLFEDSYRIESHGIHYKMGLVDHSKLAIVDTSEVTPLSETDLPQLERLYRDSYADHWFEPRMLATGYYFGVRRDSTLVSAGGVHVYSERYKVAALGNVATHPHLRGHGLATAICAKLCRSLSRTVDHIGLNVKADNTAAIRCYQKLGFERVASYDECLLEWKADP